MTENERSREIIGAAIEVHQHPGPGLPESACEEALCVELESRGIPHARQKRQPLECQGRMPETDYRIALSVDKKEIVEIKARESVSAIDKAQTVNRLRLRDTRQARINHFHEPLRMDGIAMVMNNL